MQRALLISTILFLFASNLWSATFTVTSTADSGAGSFRAALASAATSAGEDTIQFAPSLAGQAVTIIQALSVYTDAITIDTTAGDGSVDIAINSGSLDIWQQITWLGAGRILLGSTSGSSTASIQFSGTAAQSFGANIVVRPGSSAEKGIYCWNNGNSNVTLTGSITMNDSVTILREFGGNVILTGEINLGSNTLTAYCKDNMTFSGRVWNSDPSHAGKLVKIRGGSLYLKGNEDNTRLKLEMQGGIIYLQKNSNPSVHAFGGGLGADDSKSALTGAFGSIISNGPDQIADNVSIFGQSSGVSLFLEGEETIDALNGGNYRAIVGTNATLTIGANGGSGTFTGDLSLGLSIKKTGTGVQTLEPPAYNSEPTTGSICVNQGTLNVLSNLSTCSGAQISSGAKLTGTGFLPPVDLRQGGSLAPGDARLLGSIGTLNIGTQSSPSDLIWNGGGTIACELGSTGLADQLKISANFIKGSAGSYQFNFGGSGLPRQTYILAKFASTSFSVENFSFTGLAPMLEGSFSIVNGTELHFTTGRLPFQVTTTLDSGIGSLRQALLDAASVTGTNTVTFDPSLAGQTIHLEMELAIGDADGVVIDGSNLQHGVQISGRHLTRLIRIVAAGDLILKALTLKEGSVTLGGGAIQVSDQGVLTMIGCSIVRNQSNDHGGAVEILPNASASFARCTFCNNSSLAGRGGAISNAGSLAMTHCTIADNAACSGGGLANELTGVTSITNSIVAGNHLTKPSDKSESDIFNQGIGIELFGANIIEKVEADATTGDGSILRQAPILSALADFGGPTNTMALRPGSPARNAAGVISDDKDQRGFPLINLPDIGAYESENRLNCASYLAETLPLSATSLQMNPDYDFDGDGATNDQEWAAFTDPANSASKFRVISAAKSSKNFSVYFTTAAGKSYTLWQADTLSGPWQSAASFAIAGTGTPKQFSIAIPTAGVQKRFFRVQASLSP